MKNYFFLNKFEPDKFLHEGVAVVSSMRAAVAVKHSEVQQVVIDTGDTETVLILLPETQNRRAANTRKTDLREKSVSSSLHHPKSI